MAGDELVSSFKAFSQSISYMVQTLQRQGPGSFGNVGQNNNTSTSPNLYGLSIGTTSVSAIGSNQARVGLSFYNNNQTALVSFCPTFNTATGTTQNATTHGAGCITLNPLTEFRITGLRTTTAWNCCASQSTSVLTILEFL